MKRIAALIISLLMLCSGCGYQLGLAGKDTSIKRVYCYTVRNKTLQPGIEMHLTNTIIRTLQQKGEHIEVVKDKDKADTFLYVEVTEYDRAPARFNEADFLQQSSVTMFAQMFLYRSDVEDQLKRLRDPDRVKSDVTDDQEEPVVKPLYSDMVSASSRYYIEPNQPEGERSIMPQLYEEMANAIVDNIINRWTVPGSTSSSGFVIPEREL